MPRESVAEFVATQIHQARSSSGQETAQPGAAGVGAYASNARVSSTGVPAGQTISLLA